MCSTNRNDSVRPKRRNPEGSLAHYHLGISKKHVLESTDALQPIPTHQNVVSVRYCCRQELHNGEEVRYTAKNQCGMSLKDALKPKRSDAWIKTMLLQLAHGLQHLHLNGEYQGNLNLESVHLSEDQSMFVIEHHRHSSKTGIGQEKRKEEEKRKDVEKFCEILWISCQPREPGKNPKSQIPESGKNVSVKDFKCLTESDRYLAYDIVKKGMGTGLDMTAILQHPLFWDTDKKLNFLCVSGQIIANDGKKKAFDENYKKIKEMGWMESLVLDSAEIDKCKRKLSGKKPREPKKTAIRDLAEKSREKDPSHGDSCGKQGQIQRQGQGLTQHRGQGQIYSRQGQNQKRRGQGQTEHQGQYQAEAKEKYPNKSFNPNSACDLLRFIRNRKAHFRDSEKKEVRQAFQDDDTAGIWEFFDKRFPELLWLAWKAVENKRSPGFKETYITQVALNRSLPGALVCNTKS